MTELGQHVFGALQTGNLVVMMGKRQEAKSLYAVAIGPRPADLSSNRSVVAVLDIVGYKNIIRTMPLEDLKRKTTELLSFVDSTSKLAGTKMAMGAGSVPDPNLLPAVVDITCISDTLIVKSKSRDIGEAVETVCRVCCLIVDFGLFLGWLFRGAVVVGEFVSLQQRNMFLGKALVDAYELEHQQEWVGCIIGQEIETKCPEVIERLCQSGSLMRYPCPLKNDNEDSSGHLVLNWAAYKLVKNHDRRGCLKRALSVSTDSEGQQKIRNTLAFLEFITSRGWESHLPYGFNMVDLGKHTEGFRLADKKYER